MIYIGIDPGVRECGVAIELDCGEGLHAKLVQSEESALANRALHMSALVAQWLPRHSRVAVCIEGQQFYGTERSKGDPQDLIYLAQVAGAVLGALGREVSVVSAAIPLPRQWKGSTPKKIHHARLARDYPQWVEPVAQDTPKSKQHHVWDAVGLLEWHKERSKT